MRKSHYGRCQAVAAVPGTGKINDFQLRWSKNILRSYNYLYHSCHSLIETVFRCRASSHCLIHCRAISFVPLVLAGAPSKLCSNTDPSITGPSRKKEVRQTMGHDTRDIDDRYEVANHSANTESCRTKRISGMYSKGKRSFRLRGYLQHIK